MTIDRPLPRRHLQRVAAIGLAVCATDASMAAQYRMPEAGAIERAPRLLPIDPTKTGWLAAKWRRDEPPPVPRAPVGDTLRFTPIPPRAKLPIAVTIIAWQYGRTADPKLRSARPVERSFHLVP